MLNAKPPRGKGAKDILLFVSVLVVLFPVMAQETEQAAWLTFETMDGNIFIYDADKGESWFLAEGGGAVWSPDGRQLAFASDQSGKWELYVVDVEANHVRQLTDREDLSPLAPRWLPKGEIYFRWYTDLPWSTNQYECNLYVMDSGGKNIRRMTDYEHSCEWWPDVSPNGSKILFKTLDSDVGDIYVFDTDDYSFSQLTNDGFNPAWAPDSSQIAFSSERDGNWEIYIASVTDNAVHRLTYEEKLADTSPAWSSDGRRIAFLAYQGELWSSRAIYIHVMNTDGSSIQRFPVLPGVHCSYGSYAPCIWWTSDDSQIGYYTEFSSRLTEHCLDSETGENVECASGSDSVMSPDGRYVAFFAEGSFSLHVRNADGGSIRKVSQGEPRLGTVQWRPQPHTTKDN